MRIDEFRLVGTKLVYSMRVLMLTCTGELGTLVSLLSLQPTAVRPMIRNRQYRLIVVNDTA